LRTERLRFAITILLLIYVGGHIPTGIIKAMKIMSVAGAYWRGDEKQTINTCLWNIISKQKDLTEYLHY
jgi:threonyl-tRNA synthetase